ncbi:MAG: nuclear transport factor 2 family protein [Myxococcota bacterium]
MPEHAHLLAANEEFYRAFREADLPAMEALWAPTDDVACIHPGWPALRGRARVLSSWKAVLLDNTPPRVTCARVEAFQHGDVAFVTCVERVPEVRAELAATNIFVRFANEWRMVHHQAGPVSLPAGVMPPSVVGEDDDGPPTLN